MLKFYFVKHFFTPRNTFMGKRKEPEPDPYLWLVDLDPGGPKTCGSWSPTMVISILCQFHTVQYTVPCYQARCDVCALRVWPVGRALAPACNGLCLLTKPISCLCPQTDPTHCLSGLCNSSSTEIRLTVYTQLFLVGIKCHPLSRRIRLFIQQQSFKG